MDRTDDLTKKKPGHGSFRAKGRLAARSRNSGILLFVVTVCIMAAVMLAVFGTVMGNISATYTESFTASAAEVLGTRISKEIGIMSGAARSDAVVRWLADENSEQKKALAYEELSSIVGELYSFNIYAGIEASLNEYRLVTGENAEDFRPFTVLSEENPTDSWYFECMASEDDYILSVDIDHVMRRKRVWLDYKVVQDGVALGTICTGLEFSHVVGEIFSRQNDNINMRGLIVDGNGMVHVDSDLMENRDFLYSEFETPVSGMFSDTALVAAIESATDAAGARAAGGAGGTESVALSGGPYRYVTCAPIQNTDWSMVILSGNAPIFDTTLLLPLGVAALILLAAFALAVNAIDSRLIFQPLSRLDKSLTLLAETGEARIFGLDRDDELGHLSNTIQDLFNKANVDALTGIYNRRYMEVGLDRVIGLLSRSGGVLSVIMSDIDFFKKYNDTYGHDQGDVCLRAVAQTLSDSVKRSEDFAARYGGEEFVVVLPNTDAEGARLVAEKLLENVRALGIPHANNEAAPCVTISMGVATGEVKYGQSWEMFMKRADGALYKSKQSGRNRYTHVEIQA